MIDTLTTTAAARFLTVTVAERLTGGPPREIRDPALFVDRAALVWEYTTHGVRLRLRGLRPCFTDSGWWLVGHTDHVRMRPTRSTVVLFHAVGRGRRHEANESGRGGAGTGFGVGAPRCGVRRAGLLSQADFDDLRAAGLLDCWCPTGSLDFSALFHGVDERVPVDALKLGTRVLDRFFRNA